MVSPSEPREVASTIVEIARGRAATLGRGRLVCVDGPAGSGKTTLAREIGLLTDATVIHMDDLYDGWTGLDALTLQLPSILDPLAHGSSGSYRRYDWALESYAETVVVPPTPWLVLEGVGSGLPAHSGVCTVLAFVEAPPGLRLERGLARDGEDAHEHWVRWMADESATFERERPAERADVLVDGTGRSSPVIRFTSFPGVT